MKTQITKQHTEVPKTSNTSFTFHRRSLHAMLAFTAFVCLCAGSAIAQVKEAGGITSFTVQDHPKVDFVNAKPMPLPSNNSQPDSVQATIQALLSSVDLGPSGGSEGAQGSGIQSPVFLGTPAQQEGGVLPPDFGTSNHPFTTVRADLYSHSTNTFYPYRAAGRLLFNIGQNTYLCSAIHDQAWHRRYRGALRGELWAAPVLHRLAVFASLPKWRGALRRVERNNRLHIEQLL